MDGKVTAVIQAVMEEAKKKAGSADRLLAKMGKDFRRTDSMVSAYIKGDAIPPADVFLEAARVMNIKIDVHLYGVSLAAEFERMKDELDELKRWREQGGSPRRQ
jgi:hypothetical protein